MSADQAIAKATPLSRRTARWLDDRLGAASFARKALDKVFPDHWSFLLGELALWSFVVLIATGVWLTFFFDASIEEIVYEGSYVPLRGIEMSRAYASALDISFDVRAGLVMRQVHHWAANVYLATTVVHLMRIFFTGAFRRPRELNWLLGVGMLIFSIVNGFVGYSLLDDQLSGTGLRIAYNIAISIPLAGTWLASLFFGGEFPGPDLLERLYVMHILLLPAVIVALLGAHLALVARQRHTQFRGPGRTEANVIGERVWPTFAAKGLGAFLLTSAVLCALGGLAQINPIWLYGPYRPAEVSAASQPDWYMGWLDGALRLWHDWEFRAFGFEIPTPFFPSVLLPGITFTLLALWPFLETRFTGDRGEHHLLDRPRDRPLRTAFGISTLAFYTVLFFAGASDVLAVTFQTSVNALFRTFQLMLLVLPPVAGFITFRLCKELARRDRPGASDQAPAVAAPAPGEGAERRQEIEPEDEPERDPASAAGVPRR
ncbi:MAG TPA: ubiquinol-cytochrome c reductase cytochrome b subunit [Acidimicrobiales bacterium]|nr:ubiquinol-cytochrome c reductase cytochrome b subunit [Acidimicrobiales bacterium]